MKARLLLLAAAILLVASAAKLSADDDVTANNPLIPPLFSIDLASPEVTGGFLLAGDLLLPTGPNMPVVEIPAAHLSLFDPADDVDALALGALDVGTEDTFAIIFSVDRDALGAVPPDPNMVAFGFPFNVQDQAIKNQAASDAFMPLFLLDRFGPIPPQPGRSRSANNTLVINGGDAGGVDFRLHPQGLSPSTPNPPGSSQSDADSASGTEPPPALRAADDGTARRPGYDAIFFALTAGSPSLPTLPGTGSGADIYLDTDPAGPGGETLYAEPAVLGLTPEDDIDALIIFEDGYLDEFTPGSDQVVFSLTPGSPSLGGFGPGDLFTSEGFGFFTLYCQAGQLGLGPLDNLNMVDYVPCDDVHACVTDWAIGYVNPCVGDLNGDGVVNLSDLAILLSSYGKCEGEPGYIPEADLEPDGCVNLTDLAVLLAHYGETCLASPVVPEP